MVANAARYEDELEDDRRAAELDQRVFLYDVPWSEFERLLKRRGDRAGLRMAYLEGTLELMSPGTKHESKKTRLARLFEAWADAHDLAYMGIGSWTLKHKERGRGLEPDECYAVGTEEPERPDLAVEVIETSGGLDKLEIYRGLEVPEVWIWRRDALKIHLLEGEQYVEAPRSRLFPALDVALFAACMRLPTQREAVRHLRLAFGVDVRRSTVR